MRRYALRAIAVFYLTAILVGPLAIVARHAFDRGAGHFWSSISSGPALHALKVTIEIAAIAVPANTVFGIVFAIAIVRRRFPGKGLANAFVDLPLALSPVVVGLALFLLYGLRGWLGGHGVLFALPAMVLATVFVSLPFVAREVIPTLREIGDEQEQAARTLGASGWQTFVRITLPSIRWAVVYGVVLTMARSIGEYGAVSIVSGNYENRTETATLRVANLFDNYDLPGAYALSLVLAVMAVVVLVLMTLLNRREEAAA
jgi:sulfate transport system permease protein